MFVRLGIVDVARADMRRSFPARTRSVVLIEGDVREEETAARAVAALIERFGRLDALVSNAGMMIRKPYRKQELAAEHDEAGPQKEDWPTDLGQECRADPSADRIGDLEDRSGGGRSVRSKPERLEKGRRHPEFGSHRKRGP